MRTASGANAYVLPGKTPPWSTSWRFSPEIRCDCPGDSRWACSQLLAFEAVMAIRCCFALGRGAHQSRLFISADNRTLNAILGRDFSLRRFDLDSGKAIP